MKRENSKFRPAVFTEAIHSVTHRWLGRFIQLVMLIAILCNVPCLAFQASGQLIGVSDSLETRIELISAQNHLLIEGTINGKKAYFLIDTGSSYTVLDSKAAKRYDVELFCPKKSTRSSSGVNSNKRIQSSVAINVLMELGQPSFKQSYVSQNITPVVNHVYKISNIRIAGIIGSDVLKRFGCRLDLQNKTLHLMPGA